MKITEVRVKLLDEPGTRLRACCSITFDDAFVIRDLKIIEGAIGLFVAMPSRKLTSRCPRCGSKNHLRAVYCIECGRQQKQPPRTREAEGPVNLYVDIAHPINSAFREMLEQRVLQSFEEEKARSKLPGYKPSYDDFERETLVSCVASRMAAIARPRTEAAKKVRDRGKAS